MAPPGATEDSFCRNCLIANNYSISRLHQYDLCARINTNSLKLVCQWSENVWFFSRVFGWEKTEAVRLIEATSVLSRANGKKMWLVHTLIPYPPLRGLYNVNGKSMKKQRMMTGGTPWLRTPPFKYVAIKTFICTGFPAAMFDYRKVHSLSVALLLPHGPLWLRLHSK